MPANREKTWQERVTCKRPADLELARKVRSSSNLADRAKRLPLSPPDQIVQVPSISGSQPRPPFLAAIPGPNRGGARRRVRPRPRLRRDCTIVDVGGGQGVLLQHLLQAHPHLCGIVLAAGAGLLGRSLMKRSGTSSPSLDFMRVHRTGPRPVTFRPETGGARYRRTSSGTGTPGRTISLTIETIRQAPSLFINRKTSTPSCAGRPSDGTRAA